MKNGNNSQYFLLHDACSDEKIFQFDEDGRNCNSTQKLVDKYQEEWEGNEKYKIKFCFTSEVSNISRFYHTIMMRKYKFIGRNKFPFFLFNCTHFEFPDIIDRKRNHEMENKIKGKCGKA